MTTWEPKTKWYEDEIALKEQDLQVQQYESVSQRTWQPKPKWWQTTPIAEQEVETPFWRSILNVFSTPFEWIDENIIKPGGSLIGTTLGFVPEVEREVGEDYWDWKRRSWEEWDSPGFKVPNPFGEGDWTIDVRGIMQLAPWLLIPGAGQVGTAARAGRGIAGAVGKVSKPLGYAVEYSPWGIVEKTAGVALKGAVKGTFALTGKASTLIGERVFGKYKPPPTPPEVLELGKYIKETVLPAKKAMTPAEKAMRAEQELKQKKIYERVNKGEITQEQADNLLKESRYYEGGVKSKFAVTEENLARRKVEAIADVEKRIKSGEISESVGKGLITRINKSPQYLLRDLSGNVKVLKDTINKAVESGNVRHNSADALDDFLLNGTLPPDFILRDWNRIFGMEFTKAVGALTKQGTGSKVVDALNLPRALIASMDLSATLRQGLILGVLHPTKVPVWFGKQLKALVSEKWSYEIDDAMRQNPLYRQAVDDGVYFAPLRDAAPTAAEELFMSNTARLVPGVRRSERAFITYLNQARMSAYESAYGAMKSQAATPEMFKMLGQFINQASGRGSLPKSLEKYSPMLNTVIFSPRLQMATLQLPRQFGRMLLSKNPYMRKEAAKSLVAFAGAGAGLIGLMKATGSSVELDPRSGDFGKIIIGDTRLDIWRGYLQYARFGAQMLAGERKSAYGNMNDAQRSEIVTRFLQSKSSPAAGLIADLLKGETYMGEPIFSDTTGFLGVLKEKTVPLALQDIIDAMEQNGTNGLLVSTPALLGVGALTYINDYVRVKEKIAGEYGYDSWDDLDPQTQRHIQNTNREYQIASIKYDRNIMGTAFGDWRLAGKAVEDVFKETVDMAVAQYKDTGDGYQFRERVSDAYTARRGGYAAREKEERFEDIVRRLNVKNPIQSLVELGPEREAINTYYQALWGDDMYNQYGEYDFAEADARKEELRAHMGQEMFDYVEEYQGMKYDTYPPEFQELKQAQITMKPYWDIRNQLIEIYGERFLETTKGQRLLTKLRQNLRKRDPKIAYYYDMFYARK